MNKKILNQKILRYAKKLKAIDYLGGSCKECKENNLFKLTFHHRDPNEKEFTISDAKNSSWSKIKKEIDNCDILCQNCHRELHYNLKKDEERRKNKFVYLEYSGSSCIKCGYNKCQAALTFHHRDPNEKEFNIGGLNERIKTLSELNEVIKEELDKCDLLCSNCHVLEHTDIEFFNINRKIIEDKFNNYKEKQGKINRNDVYRMYESGMKQNEIAKYFNASNGSISDILSHYKELKNIKINKKVDKEVVYELYDKGYRKIDIIRELKVSKCTVYKIIRDRNK